MSGRSWPPTDTHPDPPRRTGTRAHPAVGPDQVPGRLPDRHRGRWGGGRDRRHPAAAAARGPQRRLEAVEDGRDATAGTRAARHRQDPTMEARGLPPHPHRGEIASRDESNVRTRMRQAAFPVVKTLAEFDVAASSIPAATIDYLTSLEWIRATENVHDRPRRHREEPHSSPASRPSSTGHRVRYFTAAELVDTLYRGLADNSVGKVIDIRPQRPGHRRRARLRPWTTPAPNCCSGSSRPPTNAGPQGIASHWPFDLGTVPARAHHRAHARPTPAPLPHHRHRR